MCEQKVLVINHYGYVAKCMHCNRYQLAFGTVLFYFSPFQMKMLLDNANVEKVLYSNVSNPEKKQIHLHAFSENGIFILNNNELERLIGLISEANHNERLNAILELNNIQTDQ